MTVPPFTIDALKGIVRLLNEVITTLENELKEEIEDGLHDLDENEDDENGEETKRDLQ